MAVLPSKRKMATFRKLRKSHAPSILSMRGNGGVEVVVAGRPVVVVRVLVGLSSWGTSSRVTTRSIHKLSQYMRQMELMGGRVKSPELTRAWKMQSPSASRSEALVRLGSSLSMIHRGLPSLWPMQLGS